MATNYETTLFERFFPTYWKRTDVNKDAQGKGTMERYVEVMGNELDEMVTPAIDNMLDSLHGASTISERFMGIAEDTIGNQLFITNLIALRRKVNQFIIKYQQTRGSLLSYTALFRLLGFSVNIEVISIGGFDSGESFDIGTFDTDSGCCTVYNVRLISSLTYTPDIRRAIESIVEFNEPINATLNKIFINGVDIDGPIDILTCQAAFVPSVVNIDTDVEVSKVITNTSAFTQACHIEFEFDVDLINGSTALETWAKYSCEYGKYEEYNLKIYEVMVLTASNNNPIAIGVIADNKSVLLDYRFEDATGKLTSAGLLRIIHNNSILSVDDQVSSLVPGDVLATTFNPIFDGGNVVLQVVAGAIGAGNQFIYRVI